MLRNIIFSVFLFTTPIALSASPLTSQVINSMTPPNPTLNIPELQPIYLSNTGGSIINSSAMKSNDIAMQSIHDYQNKLSKLGDSYLSTKDLAAAELAGHFLTSWAQADALTGTEKHISESDVNRYMFLSATAMNYLKVKPALSYNNQKTIEIWLLKLAKRNKQSSIYLNSNGNLRSWYALGILATGIATNNISLIDEAREKFTLATGLINDDGTIDTEIARRHRALIYTDGAAIPLVIMAELSKKINENWYTIHSGRLDLTQARILYGIKNPKWFQDRSGGATQELTHPGCWLIFFAMRHPDNQEAHEALEQKWGDYQSRIGGAATVLIKSGFFAPQ